MKKPNKVTRGKPDNFKFELFIIKTKAQRKKFNQPIGSLMYSLKVEDTKLWEQINKGDLSGLKIK